MCLILANLIQAGSFFLKNAMKVLDLSRNKLTELEAGTFDDLMSLSFLKQSSNFLQFISDRLFFKQQSLTELHLNKYPIK
jgi:hypothetical protein